MNAANLAPLVEQYIWRTDINLTRDISEKNTVQAPVLNLVGIHAAAAIIDETVTFNGRLTPTKANWIKIQVDSRSLLHHSLVISFHDYVCCDWNNCNQLK